MVLGTFTPEVAASFQFLRDAIEDVPDDVNGLRQTLTAIVDGLVHHLENQMLLVFANCAIKENETEALLEKGRHDVSLLAYYQEATKKIAAAQQLPGAADSQHQTLSKSHLNKSALLNTSGGDSAADAQLRSLAPDGEVAKHLMIMLHGQVQSVAHNVHAERAVLYLNQKSTGSLKTLCSIPDHSTAMRGQTTPNHQGVIGACFSTGIAVRVDNIDHEKRKTMYTNQIEVSSALVVPVLDPIQGLPIGVVEFLNKTNGAPWTCMDEAHAFHGSLMLQYILFQYGSRIDFFTAPVYNPSQLFVVQPYHPGQLVADLAKLPGAQSGAFNKALLVARVAHAHQLAALRKQQQHTVAPGGGGSAGLYQVEDLANVKELAEYLDLIDYNMRANINELVASKQREAESKETIQRLHIRVKVQEENAQHLQDQLNDAKRVILAQKISAAENTGRFGDGGGGSMMTYRPGMTTRQSLTQRSLQKIPLTEQSREGGKGGGDSNRSGGGAAGGTNSVSGSAGGGQQQTGVTTLRPSSLQDFLSHAAEELDRLQKKALGSSLPAQRHRMISQTPPPFSTASVGRRSPPLGGSPLKPRR